MGIKGNDKKHLQVSKVVKSNSDNKNLVGSISTLPKFCCKLGYCRNYVGISTVLSNTHSCRNSTGFSTLIFFWWIFHCPFSFGVSTRYDFCGFFIVHLPLEFRQNLRQYICSSTYCYDSIMSVTLVQIHRLQ